MRRFLQTAETFLALTMAWALVFVLPFRVAVRMLAAGAQARSQTDQVRVGDGLARRIRRMAPRLPFKTTCLVRAVAGWLMLRRRGIPAVVRFGVRVDSGTLAAHAWLMVHDVTVLGGEEADGFTPIGDFGRGEQNVPRVWSDM